MRVGVGGTKENGLLVVSWDFSNGSDKNVLTVARQAGHGYVLLNTYVGQEAVELFERLTTVAKKTEGPVD